ncbi:hypothetical protein [Streptomyces sp. NPDC021212]|uniref:hypothetical protein n=1 Tax=Streptomyces sp. NPDC021212 TaxID=3365118 RepID=UPI00379D6C92
MPDGSSRPPGAWLNQPPVAAAASSQSANTSATSVRYGAGTGSPRPRRLIALPWR